VRYSVWEVFVVVQARKYGKSQTFNKIENLDYLVYMRHGACVTALSESVTTLVIITTLYSFATANGLMS
jgi:hypothetical protein